MMADLLYFEIIVPLEPTVLEGDLLYTIGPSFIAYRA